MKFLIRKDFLKIAILLKIFEKLQGLLQIITYFFGITIPFFRSSSESLL